MPKLVVIEEGDVRTVAERSGSRVRVVDLAESGVRVRLLERQGDGWVVRQDAWLDAGDDDTAGALVAELALPGAA